MRVPLGLWDRTGRPMPDVYLLKPLAGDLVDPTAMGSLVTYDRHPVRAALELAASRIRAFHARQLEPDLDVDLDGVRLELRVTPLARAGPRRRPQ